MLGIFLVIAGVVLAAYLVIKRYYAPWALLMVGIRQLPAFFYSLPRGSLKTATVA